MPSAITHVTDHRTVVLPIARRGKPVAGVYVPMACGHGELLAHADVGVSTKRCDVCHLTSRVEVRRSDIQEAWVVPPATLVGQMSLLAQEAVA